MIYDTLNNYHLYKGINANLDIVIDFIQSHDLSKLPEGKTMIKENQVWVTRMSYQTKKQEDCRFEAHQLYGDVQIVLNGCEYMGYAPINEIILTDEYNSEKDIIHGSGTPFTLCQLNNSMSAVFFAEDAHMAKINPTLENVDKLCFKFKLFDIEA